MIKINRLNILCKISLFHPFSPKAIGLSKLDVLLSHSVPHVIALKSLDNNEYKVSVGYFGRTLFPHKKNKGLIKKWFWPVTNLRVNNLNRWRKEYSIWHLVYNLICPPDLTIINMSGNLSPYTKILGRLLKKRNKPYIAMLGGLHIAKDKSAIDYFINAQLLIVHTQSQKKAILKINDLKGTKVYVMPLGVDTSVFKPILKPITNSIKLLYVGRISRLKQIEIAIETVSYFLDKGYKDIKLHIIGPYSDIDYYNELKSLVASKNLSQNVFFLGSVEHSKLVKYYQDATLLLLPSQHESFGMVLIEAMSCGTPVAALLNSGGPEEIISADITGLLADKQNFKKQVFELILDKKKHTLISENCRTNVLEKWSLKQTTSILENSVKWALNHSLR